MKCHDGPHDGEHPYYDDDGEICFGCKVKTISTDPGQARITQGYGGKRREVKEPSWEKGLAGEHRPGGGFMPYLDDNGKRIGLHRWQSERSRLMESRKQQLAS